MFVPKQSLYQKEATVWRLQKCIPLVREKTPLTYAGLQTTLSHVSRCRARNGNLRKSRSTFHNRTMFAPKQCLYQKEATGMEKTKMRSSSQCKNRTYVCGTANYTVSCKPVQGRERKFAEIQAFLSPCLRIWTKAMFISKRSYRYMESQKMHSSSQCKNRTYMCGTANYPISCKPV